MGLKAVLDEDQFGELDESAQGLYRQEDDNYVLDVEGLDSLPSVQQAYKKKKISEDHRKKAETRLQDYEHRFGPLAEVEGLDLSSADPERIEQLRPYLTGEQELPEPGDKSHKIDVEKVKANAIKPYTKERDEWKEKHDRTQALLHQHVRDSALTEAISKAKVAEPYFDAAMAMFRPRIKVMEDEGKLIPVIEDEVAGEMPVEKFVKEWSQTDQGRAFIEATGNSGGGARGGSGGDGKIKNPFDPANRDVKEQNRIFREDPDRAKKMAAQHGVNIG